MNYETAEEIELALVNALDAKQNLLVPNVSWGLGLYECDLLQMSKTGYLTEYEIKISESDLKRDQKKLHHHHNRKIRRLYFAMPERMRGHFLKIESMIDCAPGIHIPDDAGLVFVNKEGKCDWFHDAWIRSDVLPLTEKDQYKLARLGALRIWQLKEKLIKLQRENDEIKSEFLPTKNLW